MISGGARVADEEAFLPNSPRALGMLSSGVVMPVLQAPWPDTAATPADPCRRGDVYDKKSNSKWVIAAVDIHQDMSDDVTKAE